MPYSNSVTRELSDPCSDGVPSVARDRLIVVDMARAVVPASRGSFSCGRVEQGCEPRVSAEAKNEAWFQAG